MELVLLHSSLTSKRGHCGLGGGWGKDVALVFLHSGLCGGWGKDVVLVFLHG